MLFVAIIWVWVLGHNLELESSVWLLACVHNSIVPAIPFVVGSCTFCLLAKVYFNWHLVLITRHGFEIWFTRRKKKNASVFCHCLAPISSKRLVVA